MKTAYMNIALSLALAFITVSLVPDIALAAADHGSSQAAGESGSNSIQIYTTSGVVDEINKTDGKIIITHEPVPALGWPVMTMGFAFEDTSLLEGLKAGDKVRFDFRRQGNVSIIVDIEVRQ